MYNFLNNKQEPYDFTAGRPPGCMTAAVGSHTDEYGQTYASSKMFT